MAASSSCADFALADRALGKEDRKPAQDDDQRRAQQRADQKAGVGLLRGLAAQIEQPAFVGDGRFDLIAQRIHHGAAVAAAHQGAASSRRPESLNVDGSFHFGELDVGSGPIMISKSLPRAGLSAVISRSCSSLGARSWTALR